MDRVLWILESRLNRAWIGLNQVTETRAIFDRASADRHFIKRVPETQRVKHARGMGHDIDPDAERLQFLHRLEDLDANPLFVETQCSGQAADSGACYGNLHHLSLEQCP